MRETNIDELADEGIDLQRTIGTIWRGKFLIAFIGLSCFFLSLLYSTQRLNPVFESNAILGFENQKSRNLNIGGLERFVGFSSLNSLDPNGTIITQIKGRNFLIEVVLQLKLFQDPEFVPGDPTPPKGMLNILKHEIKTILGLPKQKRLSEKEKIEAAVVKLKNSNFTIKSMGGGAFEISVKTGSAEKSALIANTIAQKFLDKRLSGKVYKSEQALAYLTNKLGEARIKMEEADKAVEIFALERNVLSNTEYGIQVRKLREFRINIKRLQTQKRNLEEFQSVIYQTFEDKDVIRSNLDELYELSPRIKPRVISRRDTLQEALAELEEVRENFPLEISRISEAIQITRAGFEELQKEAKESSIDSRELGKLQKEFSVRTAAHDSLLKQIEAQSLVDGYQEALGEIYQTATPALVRSSPRHTVMAMISTILGSFVGAVIVLIYSSLTKRIWYDYEFKRLINTNDCLLLSQRFKKLNLSLISQNPKRMKNKLKSDLVLLNAISSKISERSIQSNETEIKFVCAGLDKSYSATSLCLALANILQKQGFKVEIVDYSSMRKKTQAIIKGNNLLGNKRYIPMANISYQEGNLDDDTFLSNVNSEQSPKAEGVKNLSKDKKVFLIITNQVLKEIIGISKVLTADLFSLIGTQGKLTEDELFRIKKSIGEKMDRCTANILVKT